MKFDAFSFGFVRVDGAKYDHDLVLDRGTIRKRKKMPSQPFRAEFGHTRFRSREKNPVEVPAAGDWDGCAWLPAGDEMRGTP